MNYMILRKYVYNTQSIAQKVQRQCEDNHGEKSPITMMQQRSAVDSRHRLTNCKMSLNVSSLETV